MAILTDFYNEKNDIWGLPQVYRGISFYPIKIKDYRSQELFYQLFYYPKNNIPDKKILKMSYLKFLLFAVAPSVNMNIESMIIDFFQFIAQSNHVAINYSDGNNIDDLRIILKIDGVTFEESDFDILREIILRQNGSSVEYVESYNPELEEHLAFINRKFSDVTFEDEVLIFCSLMKKTISEIGEYTFYQFKKHMERMMLLYSFTLYSPLEISGQIKAKDGGDVVKHYLSHIPARGRYDEILIKKETFEDKTDLFNKNLVKFDEKGD